MSRTFFEVGLYIAVFAFILAMIALVESITTDFGSNYSHIVESISSLYN